MTKTKKTHILAHLENLLNVDRSCFAVLSDKQLYVFYHRFDNYEIRRDKYRVIGEEYGVTRQAVHQIYKRACRTLSKQECFIALRETLRFKIYLHALQHT